MAAILSLLYDPTFSFRAGTELITTIFSKINEADIFRNMNEDGCLNKEMIEEISPPPSSALPCPAVGLHQFSP